ncbi:MULTISPECIES: hypothetical protein [unclassified Streptomyces]|uniref:hypothetical protein n=1 Tax=unclassified Streptomyces TaxID=2593676 RepID=UPI0032517CC3
MSDALKPKTGAATTQENHAGSPGSGGSSVKPLENHAGSVSEDITTLENHAGSTPKDVLKTQENHAGSETA